MPLHGSDAGTKIEGAHMALNDVAIRVAKSTNKSWKLADEKGLFLLIQPTGGKLWRMDYRFADKRKTLACGTYPDTSLKFARDKRDAARKLLADGSHGNLTVGTVTFANPQRGFGKCGKSKKQGQQEELLRCGHAE